VKIGQIRRAVAKDEYGSLTTFEIRTTFEHLPEMVACEKLEGRLPDIFRTYCIMRPGGGSVLGEMWSSGCEDDGAETYDLVFTNAPGVKGIACRAFQSSEPDVFDLFILPRTITSFRDAA